MKKVILPIDGFSDFKGIVKLLEKTFAVPGVREIISHVKLNDVVYSENGCDIMQFVEDWLIENDHKDVKIFLDLKLSDTSGTNMNILKQYTERGMFPDILTIRECCSSATFKEVRKLLPNTILALVSVLTDTSEEECVFRYGMKPTIKIATDTEKINILCPGILDAVVCSPLEVGYLKNILPNMKYIVPGIRDKWMKGGQQKRFQGIRFAFENGADWAVAGSQLYEGNPENGISAEQSVRMTVTELAKVQLIVLNDHYQTLRNFNAMYVSRQDDCGNYLGPLVAYAGLGDDGKPKVGYHYYNMACIEESAQPVLSHFAKILANKITEKGIIPDVMLGAPMGGIGLGKLIALELGCRFAYAEKEVLKKGDPGQGTKDQAKLVIKRHTINAGDKVIVSEDLCNNFATTEELFGLIDSFDASIVAVTCIVNRSWPTQELFMERPVVSVIDLPTAEYDQTDEFVQNHLNSGNVSWKPKHEWKKLKEAMVVEK